MKLSPLESKMMAWAGCRFSLSVSFVMLLIAFLYFSTVFVFLSQWFGVWSSTGMLNTFAFTTILVFCIFNYILAMFTNPGRVPTNTDEDDNIIVQEIMPKDGDLRYCQRITIAFGLIIVWVMETISSSSSPLSMLLQHAYIPWSGTSPIKHSPSISPGLAYLPYLSEQDYN
nr:probable protein S-acyltransferase 16 isoform X3 [Ipomoea trifida]